MKKIVLLISTLLISNFITLLAIAPPTVYLAVGGYNTAIGAGTYCLDQLDDLLNTNPDNKLSYARPIAVDPNNYAYVIESRSANPLNELLSGVATSVELEPIYIRNTGRNNINFFGGYFGNADASGTTGTDSLKITIDDYVYRYKPTYGTNFVGFVFSTGFTEVKIESMSTNTTRKCPAISRVIWGSSLPVGIQEQKKQVVVFPNPTTDGITVNADGTVSIINSVGQLMLSEAVTSGSYIALNQLPKGLYIVKIESEAGIAQTKLIKK